MEAPPARRRGTPAGWAGLRLGRVLGIPVRVSVSLVLLAAVMAAGWGSALRAARGLAAPAAYGFSLALAVALVLSVLVHELAHALLARRAGVGVRGITLYLLGGYTEMDGEAPNPGAEVRIALAGPAVSAALGLAFGGAALLLPRPSLALPAAVYLCLGNLIIAVFNVLPGLPLDGGRALRALVWRVTGDPHRATETAGRAGWVLAALTGALGLAGYVAGLLDPLGVLVLGVVAVSMWFGAGEAVRAGRVGRRIPALRVAALTHPLVAVPAGTPLAEARRRAGTARIGIAGPDGRVRAVVVEAAAVAVPPASRPWVPVEQVAREVDGCVLPVDLAGPDVISAVRAHPADEYLVTSGDDVVGVLRLADIAHRLDARGTTR